MRPALLDEIRRCLGDNNSISYVEGPPDDPNRPLSAAVMLEAQQAGLIIVTRDSGWGIEEHLSLTRRGRQVLGRQNWLDQVLARAQALVAVQRRRYPR